MRNTIAKNLSVIVGTILIVWHPTEPVIYEPEPITEIVRCESISK
jgi:hypothetical protein